MADILMRASETIGGITPFGDEEVHFFRSPLLNDVATDDCVYFVASGPDYGCSAGEGAIIAYATFCRYELVTGELIKDGQPTTDTKDAYIVRGPWSPIERPVCLTDGYKGSWRVRYVDRIPGLAEQLRAATAKSS